MKYKIPKHYNVNHVDTKCWGCIWRKRGEDGCNNNHYCIDHDKFKESNY